MRPLQLVNTVAFQLGISTQQLFVVVAQNLDLAETGERLFLEYIESGSLPENVSTYLHSFIKTEEELCRTS